MKDNWKHARGCSDILSTNEECSGCWERLWRSPLWKIQVRLRLSTQALDERAGSSGGSCGRRGTSLRYTWMTAAGSPSHDGRLWTCGVWLVTGRTAWSAGPWFPFPIIFPNPKSEIEANAQMLEQVMYLLMMEVVSPWDTRTMWTYAAKDTATLAPHLSRHPKGIREEERFLLEERRKRVRGNDRVPGCEKPHKLRGSTKSQKQRVRPRAGKDRQRLRQHRSHLRRRTADCGCVLTTELSIKPRWWTDILSHWSRSCSTGPQ